VIVLDEVNDLETTAAYLKMLPTKLASIASGPTPKIGSIKEGRTRTFPRAAIEAYVEANTIHPVTPPPFGLTERSARRVRRSP